MTTNNPTSDDVLIKDIATEFYYSWHNSGGTNTSQGFDDWWEVNKERFVKRIQKDCDGWIGVANITPIPKATDT